MASLVSLIAQLPEWAQRQCGMAKARPKVEELAEAVAKAGAVVAEIGSRGAQLTQDEAAAQGQVLLEQFIAEDDAAAGTRSIKTWDEFVELRGFVRGFRARRTLGAAIVKAGAAAELQLEKLREKQGGQRAG